MAEPILLIATTNAAKFAEIKELLVGIPYTIVSLTDVGIDYDVEETGATFEENALLKARTYSHMSGLLTLADDSGFEVTALNGEPGIHTKGYAGPHATDEEKVQFLLNKMVHIPEGTRQARDSVYVTLVWPSGESKVVEAHCLGRISVEPKGKLVKNFPYRTLFIPEHSDETLAELSEKGISMGSPRTMAIAHIKEILVR